MWDIGQALELVRKLQPELHARKYHVALGGGVLNKGFSKKDLDLYFFSFDNETITPIMPYLEELWGAATPLGSEIIRKERGYPPDRNFKVKVKFFTPLGRIDVFLTDNGVSDGV